MNVSAPLAAMGDETATAPNPIAITPCISLASTSSTSAKRARKADDDLDAALGSLVSKLGATTTDDPDALVALLVDVLKVEPSEATFYLEASSYNPHAAVQLHMQSSAGGSNPRWCHPEMSSKKPKPPPRFTPQPVLLDGLPDGWSAQLSSAGTIVFVHTNSGHEQGTAPVGFGCAAPTPTATSDAAKEAQSTMHLSLGAGIAAPTADLPLSRGDDGGMVEEDGLPEPSEGHTSLSMLLEPHPAVVAMAARAQLEGCATGALHSQIMTFVMRACGQNHTLTARLFVTATAGSECHL
eukprot:CAMPEP_0115846716 /NCGR_PEP_ID=MMETSP0287-20121206/10003_1 /TAXON_ID=412157 /ORGANISM="Chrysochromulina rotalis, Strain UIO044" /LENGTH=295 /DNA_ID=CAMNT_0003300513 /DNA_START=41 /DNA_END=929 /DNA_ORIENTATION=-